MAAGFVAPRARTAGTPSPEALARLAAAVNRAPGRQPAQQPAAAAAPASAAPRGAVAAEKPRFGINSLINRMTGHSGDPQGERGQSAVRAQPPVTAYDEEQEPDPEQERIEIPAFLRRQAN